MTKIPEPKLAFDYLQELINTMQQVIDFNELTKDANKKAIFDMNILLDNVTNENHEVYHFCGTSGCICGWQALVENPEISSVHTLQALSYDIIQKMTMLLGEFLPESIYGENYVIRNAEAECAELQNTDFAHLQSNYTTPEDAIEYMEYIQTICKEQM
jgi:hypothetical protein